MTRAFALVATLLACSRGDPTERPGSPSREGPAAPLKPRAPDVVRDGRTAATCPALPDPVAVRPAPAARRWPLRVAADIRLLPAPTPNELATLRDLHARTAIAHAAGKIT